MRLDDPFSRFREVNLSIPTRGLGPAITGVGRLCIMKALRRKLGVILGVDSDTPDYTVRAVLEYEF